MKVLNDLSIQDLKLNKKRSIVIIIGIILSTALICGVAGLVTSFQKTMVNTAKEGQGNYHTIFYNVPKEELKYIEENREVKDYFLSEELGYSYLPNHKNVEETPIVNVISMNDKFIENMSVKLKEGRLPENDTELAISTRINAKFNTNYKVGDTITLNINETEQNMENGIPKTYKIVGIIERPILAIESYDVDWFTAITKMQNVNKKANIAVLYNKPKDYIKNTETINNITKTENKVNKELLAYEGTSLDDETLKTIYGLGAFIIGIVLVSSVFVIRNGFEISITERLKQYGMLSSIGATKKQIKKSVYFEGFILGLIGIPLGIISGVFAIYILVNVVNYILKDYISKGTLLTFSISWIAIAISVFVAIITIWLSCKKSAQKASKVSPIEAIRNTEDVKLKAKR